VIPYIKRKYEWKVAKAEARNVFKEDNVENKPDKSSDEVSERSNSPEKENLDLNELAEDPMQVQHDFEDRVNL